MLERCLQALAAQSMPDFEVVVLDNGSRDPELGLALPDGRFRLVRSETNLGFAAGNNLAAKDCATPFIATLNTDAFAEPDWLLNLRIATERYPWASAFGSTQLRADDPEIVDGFGDAYAIWGSAWRCYGGCPVSELPSEDQEVFSPCAAAALYAIRAFQEAGGFDEDFFCYLEDVDLGFRLRLRGHRSVQVRNAVVLHIGSATAGAKSPFAVTHSYRNRLWLLFKDVPFPLLLPLAVLQLPLTFASACLSRHVSSGGAALKGIFLGLLGLPRILAKRRQVQRARRLGNFDVARLLVWSPFRRGRPARAYACLAERPAAGGLQHAEAAGTQSR